MITLPGTTAHRVEDPRRPTTGPLVAGERPRPVGKFLRVGARKLYVRGVTYGPLLPRPEAPDGLLPDIVDRDFAAMAENGINAVRVYDAPQHWVLDLAARHGLYVLVGLAWEQHVAFLSDRRRMRSIGESLRTKVKSLAGHPALLAFAVGNEIPAGIVRWHGRQAVERWIERLYGVAKETDPDAIVTYVNYPTTEYLDLPFLDIASWNVFLESPSAFAAYLPRLHSLAGDRPVMITELGLDSRRHGEPGQARAVDWQLRLVYAAGVTGAFVFSWTDEWSRGGETIDDWGFGLTTTDRLPRPALAAVHRAFDRAPFSAARWPSMSVVICSYNGERTIRDCLEGVARLDYPDFEVIVVDDGSTDRTGEIARGLGARVIRQSNRGLSAARNAGLAAARGELIAYTDDDAWPDEDWLRYLAATFMATRHAAVGGPNIAPPGDGAIAECVANAPGGPMHVLLSDVEAEHVPGCNMAFRREALMALGGFDTRFRVAGDDVDLCWRLRDQGWTIGFSPAAMVWHHRRNSIRTYLRQQRGYGRAEALLEAKWPERYTPLGHFPWAGRLYGGDHAWLPLRSARVYAGIWGSAPFGRLYRPAVGRLEAVCLTPEWYLLVWALAACGLVGLAWPPLLIALPLAALALVPPLVVAVRSAASARFPSLPRGASSWRRRSLVAALHLAQPIARLVGRVGSGLTPWRRRGSVALAPPMPWRSERLSAVSRAPERWLEDLRRRLAAWGAVVLVGGALQPWDLEVRGGLLAGCRVRLVVEEHGQGVQMIRIQGKPRPAWAAVVVASGLAILGGLAAVQTAPLAAGLLIGCCLLLLARMLYEAGRATALARRGANAWEAPC